MAGNFHKFHNLNATCESFLREISGVLHRDPPTMYTIDLVFSARERYIFYFYAMMTRNNPSSL